jgi:hypothetical protein
MAGGTADIQNWHGRFFYVPVWVGWNSKRGLRCRYCVSWCSAENVIAIVLCIWSPFCVCFSFFALIPDTINMLLICLSRLYYLLGSPFWGFGSSLHMPCTLNCDLWKTKVKNTSNRVPIDFALVYLLLFEIHIKFEPSGRPRIWRTDTYAHKPCIN